jgi:hypothetical protein
MVNSDTSQSLASIYSMFQKSWLRIRMLYVLNGKYIKNKLMINSHPSFICLSRFYLDFTGCSANVSAIFHFVSLSTKSIRGDGNSGLSDSPFQMPNFVPTNTAHDWLHIHKHKNPEESDPSIATQSAPWEYLIK